MKVPQLIPPDNWKKIHKRLVYQAKRNLVPTEVNPGPESKRLRYDYLVNSSDLERIVREAMKSTEQAIIIHQKLYKDDK